MDALYWYATVVSGVVGVALFSFSARRYHAQGRRELTGVEIAAGLLGLGLAGWGILLAVIGGVVEIVQALS